MEETGREREGGGGGGEEMVNICTLHTVEIHALRIAYGQQYNTAAQTSQLAPRDQPLTTHARRHTTGPVSY